MTRWIMIGLTVFGFALAFATHSAGVLAIGLLLGFGGLFGIVFVMAADRVSASLRPDSAMLSTEDLAAMRARAQAAAARNMSARADIPKSPAQSPPPAA